MAACTPSPAPDRAPPSRPSVTSPSGCVATASAAAGSVDGSDGRDVAITSDGPDEMVVVALDSAGRPAIVNTSTASASDTVDRLEADGSVDVVAVERDRSMWTLDGQDTEPASVPDALRSQQWALDRFGIEELWTGSTGTDVDIAVVDTGVDASHPDLSGRVCPGVSFVGAGGSPQPGGGSVDPNGHGTHVAAIAAANTGDGVGIAGVAPSARIIPVSVLDSHGFGSSADVGRGITWAVDHGAEIVNVSLGGARTAAVDASVRYADDRGVLVVAAAGNGGLGAPAFYPAAIPEVLAVGSFDRSGAISSFSTRGDYVDVAAPGSGILSAAPGGGWVYRSGTSMAAPHVAGTAALILARSPGLDPSMVRDRIESSAQDAGPIGRDRSFGEGRLVPSAALGD